MWEFYLAASEAAFRWQDLMVFQIQIARRNDVLPITRSYMAKNEKTLALHEMAHPAQAPVLEKTDRAAPEARDGRRKVIPRLTPTITFPPMTTSGSFGRAVGHVRQSLCMRTHLRTRQG
jgi:hypothetical protein